MAGKWTFAEIDYVERLTKLPMDEWSKTMNARAVVFWSVRRRDPALLSWEQSGDLAPEDLEWVDEPEDEDTDADPPAESPSDSPAMPDDSSTTSEPTTSSTSPATSD
jgi:hypothetical protein